MLTPLGIVDPGQAVEPAGLNKVGLVRCVEREGMGIAELAGDGGVVVPFEDGPQGGRGYRILRYPSRRIVGQSTSWCSRTESRNLPFFLKRG